MIKDLSGHQQEPFSFDASSIIAGFIDKGHLNFSFDFLGSSVHQLIVGSLEKMGSVDLNVNSPAVSLPSELRMVSEDELFGFKVNELGLFQN